MTQFTVELNLVSIELKKTNNDIQQIIIIVIKFIFPITIRDNNDII